MTGPRRACTIAAREALARARVMIVSLEKHHPGVEIVTLITDGSEADRSIAGLGEILLPGDLLPDREWADMAAIYDADEFAGALKPAARSKDPWTDDRAPVEWITDRMIVAFGEHGGSLAEHLLPTAPK